MQDLISGISQNAEKAQDLVMAASGKENAKEVYLLTAASVKRLDDDLRTVHDDLRTVHANTVTAAQDAQDSEGWMRWVRKDHEQDIRELKMTIRTIINVMWPMLDDAQKAEVGTAPVLCARQVTNNILHEQFTKNEADVKAMREDVDHSYMAKVRPTGKGQGTGDVNHE